MTRSMGLKTVFVFAMASAWICAAVQAEQPTVVLGIKSVESILEGIDLIGEVVGEPGLRATMETSIEQFTGGAGEDGVDRDRPLGVYWNIDESNPQGLGTLVVFIPVSSADNFEKLIRKFVPNLETADGQWKANVQGVPLFGTVSEDYFFVTTSSDGLSDLAEPESIVGDDYDIAIELNIAGIPQHLKAAFLSGVEQSAKNSSANAPPPQSDVEEQGRALGEEWTMAAIKSVANDGQKLTFGIDIDTESRMGTVDLALTGVPDSSLAKAFAVYNKLTPAFANVPTESTPLSLVMSIPTTGLKKVDSLFKAIRESAMTEIDKDPKLTDAGDKRAAKDVANRLLTIFEATVKSGSLHSVIVMEEGDGDTIRLIGGTKVAKGDDAGKLWDDILKLSKESPDLAKVKTDVAKHAGARIHSITGDLDEKQEEMFGDNPIHLAIRPDSLWMAMGGGNLDALKNALDQSGKKAAKATPPISLRVMPATLVTFLEEDDEQLIERAKTLAGEDGDILVFEVAPADTNGVKMHFGFGLDLFTLAGDKIRPPMGR